MRKGVKGRLGQGRQCPHGQKPSSEVVRASSVCVSGLGYAIVLVGCLTYLCEQLAHLALLAGLGTDPAPPHTVTTQ